MTEREHRERRDGHEGGGRKPFMRQKRCRFCGDNAPKIDYKDGKFMATLVSDRGKILPRRLTGVCAKHQRKVTRAIKRARGIALLPYTTIYQA